MSERGDFFVYRVSSNKADGALYTGITNDLERRLWEHRHPETATFAAQYHCIHLVFYERFPDARSAIAREKEIKGWTRKKKEALIATVNPGRRDLAGDLFER
jgi:putative endonuclease